MARSEARIFTSIWSDRDFRPLSAVAKTTYLFVLTQPDLSHCGVIPLRPARWAGKFNGLSAAQMGAGTTELALARFVVPDEDTGELLVRSLIRRDKVLRQPFLYQPFAASVADVESIRILSVLLAEIVRVQAAGDVNPKISRDVNALVARLERHLDCLSDTLSGTDSDSQPDSHPETHTGIGGSNGLYHKDSPIPESPSPRSHLRSRQPDAHEAQQVRPQEGEDSPGSERDIPALAAEVRAIRPEWSTASVQRVLTSKSVAERPWPAIRAAALAVAADPASQGPGRLAHDGPWWHRPSSVPQAEWPPWCGKCHPDNRLLDVDDGARAARCTDCHPSREEA